MAEVVDIGAWQWQMVGNEVRGRRENWELKEKEEEILNGVQEKYKPLVLLSDRVWHFVFKGLSFENVVSEKETWFQFRKICSRQKSLSGFRFIVTFATSWNLETIIGLHWNVSQKCQLHDVPHTELVLHSGLLSRLWKSKPLLGLLFNFSWVNYNVKEGFFSISHLESYGFFCA